MAGNSSSSVLRWAWLRCGFIGDGFEEGYSSKDDDDEGRLVGGGGQRQILPREFNLAPSLQLLYDLYLMISDGHCLLNNNNSVAVFTSKSFGYRVRRGAGKSAVIDNAKRCCCKATVTFWDPGTWLKGEANTTKKSKVARRIDSVIQLPTWSNKRTQPNPQAPKRASSANFLPAQPTFPTSQAS